MGGNSELFTIFADNGLVWQRSANRYVFIKRLLNALFSWLSEIWQFHELELGK